MVFSQEELDRLTRQGNSAKPVPEKSVEQMREEAIETLLRIYPVLTRERAVKEVEVFLNLINWTLPAPANSSTPPPAKTPEEIDAFW
jgi:hypothetical protein